MNGSYEATMGGAVDGAEKKGNQKSPIAIQKDTLRVCKNFVGNFRFPPLDAGRQPQKGQNMPCNSSGGNRSQKIAHFTS